MHKLTQSNGLEFLPVEALFPHPDNPRLPFKDADVRGLADSLQQVDLLAPLIVRPRGGRQDQWEICCGERRWRAAKLADVGSIPCLVRDLDDDEALEVMTRENFDRKQLNAIEKARAVKSFVDRGLSQRQVGAMFDHSGAWAANLLRLLRLPQGFQDKVVAGEISEHNARLLVPYVGDSNFLKAVAAGIQHHPEDWEGRRFELNLKMLAVEKGRLDPQANGSAPTAPIPPARSPRPAAPRGGDASLGRAAAPSPPERAPLNEDRCRELLRPYTEAELMLIRNTVEKLLAGYAARR
jgi:ParB/RepB/Spo0J family partition protein